MEKVMKGLNNEARSGVLHEGMIYEIKSKYHFVGNRALNMHKKNEPIHFRLILVYRAG